jgi:tRNA(Ile)-lysidine synthase
MQTSLAKRVLFALQRAQQTFHPGDRVGVAVSGGADSVALLLLLLELREELGIVLNVVHFNHKLRGKASDTDEKFVEKLAAKHTLPFHAGRTEVAVKAKREKANLEDAARRARYSFFEQLVAAGKLDLIAVAHTADDQAETVLAHILRGTGLAGLSGIHPSVGHVVRPLLGARRMELRAYLKSRKQAWREDATNRDTTKMRARIRKKLLPLLERQFQSGVVEHLATLAEFARGEEALLDEIVEERFNHVVRKSGGCARISIADLVGVKREKRINAEGTEKTECAEERDADDARRRRLIRRCVREVKRNEGQLTAQHVDAVLELAVHGLNGKALELPGGVEVRREHDALVFVSSHRDTKKGRTKRESAKKYEYKIDSLCESSNVCVIELGCAFRLTAIDWPSKREETTNIRTVLDRDQLRFPLVLRNWRPGDKLHPLGRGSARKLKRLLSEKRISRWERDGWPVLTSGGVLAWARGFPVAAEFAANERTRTGIVIAEENL